MKRARISTRRQRRALVIPKPDRKGNIKVPREGWLNCARVALIEDGIDGVKADRLAQRAGVTRGGFYHHFEKHQDLLDALLDLWQRTNHFTPDEVDALTPTSASAALDLIIDNLVHERGFDPQFDMAVREWARISQPVADVVHGIDERRVGILRQIFTGMGYASKDALIRARVFYWHQIGYYAVGFRETVSTRESHLPVYIRVLAGDRYRGMHSER